MISTFYIADDHQVVTDGLKNLLSKEFKNSDVQTFLDGEALKERLKKQIPNLLILDLNLPKLNGIKILEFIKNENIQTKIIVFTMYNKVSLLKKCRALGANGYLLKNASNQELISMLDKLDDGDLFITDDRIDKKTLSEDIFNDGFEEISLLTTREKEIVKLLLKDYTSEAISTELFISKHTVESHRKNIRRKLKLKGFSINEIARKYSLYDL